MSDSPEVIKEQMEETREDLAHKLQALTDEVSETVHNVTETVEETVETVTETAQSTVQNVKDFFNFNKQIEDRPWLMFGGAVIVGFLAGRTLISWTTPSTPPRRSAHRGMRESLEEARHSVLPDYRSSASSQTNGQHRDSGSSWFGSIRDSFGPVLNQLSGVAVGAALSVVRDVVQSALPDNVKDQVNQAFSNLTEKFGGQPSDSSERSEGERTEQRKQSQTPVEGESPSYSQVREMTSPTHQK